MKIRIAEQEYTLTDASIAAILGSIEHFATDQYDKLPDTAKFAAMAAVRALLAYAEKAEHDPERKKEIRPPKKTDPSIHLIRLLLKYVGEALPHVNCEIATDGSNISNFAFQYEGEGGGPLPIDRHIGEREDNGSQIA